MESGAALELRWAGLHIFGFEAYTAEDFEGARCSAQRTCPMHGFVQPHASRPHKEAPSHVAAPPPVLCCPLCSTVLMPRWFLPLACTANLAKNLAAVRAHSFALRFPLVPV